MPRSSTTRHGTGAGYGGEARGEGNKGAGPGRPRKDVAELIAADKAARIAAMKENLLELAVESERDSDRIAATMGFLKHEDPPLAKSEVTLRNVAAEDLTDDELADIIARGRGASGRAPENQG